MFTEYEDLKKDLDGGNELRPNTIKFKMSMKKEELEQVLKEKLEKMRNSIENVDKNSPLELKMFLCGWDFAFLWAKDIIEETFSKIEID